MAEENGKYGSTINIIYSLDIYWMKKLILTVMLNALNLGGIIMLQH